MQNLTLHLSWRLLNSLHHSCISSKVNFLCSRFYAPKNFRLYPLKQYALLSSKHFLPSANEGAAMELMQKYQNQDNHSPEAICSLFRWVAILRAELSEAQNRSRKYRADAHRLRRAHAASTKLVTDLERQLEHYKSRVNQMELEMAHLLEESTHSPSAEESFFAISTASSRTPTRIGTTTPATESRLGLEHCLHFIDMPTPEVSSSALKRKVDGASMVRTGVMVLSLLLNIRNWSCDLLVTEPVYHFCESASGQLREHHSVMYSAF